MERLKQQGQQPPQSILEPSRSMQQLKTAEPAPPDFTGNPREISKLGGCLSRMYTRYFIVDQSHFKYYENKNDRTLKNTLEIAKA